MLLINIVKGTSMPTTAIDYKLIKDSIIKSQHCQRNWDLTKKIPKQDLELIIEAATQCPSKQNIAFYKLHFITNRDVIERIHSQTWGVIKDPITREQETNSQVLANLLIVFEDVNYVDKLSQDPTISRNDESKIITGELETTSIDSARRTLERDKNMAVGIAAGYVNVIANIIGYNTGCCACFDSNSISEMLNLKGNTLLLMGVGFKDPTRNRRLHEKTNFLFPTFKKQPIEYTFVE